MRDVGVEVWQAIQEDERAAGRRSQNPILEAVYRQSSNPKSGLPVRVAFDPAEFRLATEPAISNLLDAQRPPICRWCTTPAPGYHCDYCASITNPELVAIVEARPSDPS